MNLVNHIEKILEPSLLERGIEIVRVHISNKEGYIIQIMIEHCNNSAVTINDCAMLSKDISILLDVEDILPKYYVLEVSSPGIDRPLTKVSHFKRFKGCLLSVKTGVPFNDRRHFKGKLTSADDKAIILELDFSFDGRNYVEIGYNEILSAKIQTQL
ncbi:MAG: ribosome maturation factor RimP [Alphaproteobacteria bacterium]